MDTQIISVRLAKIARYCWIGTFLPFVLLEVFTIYSQYRKHNLGRIRLCFLPVMMTLPLSVAAPLFQSTKRGIRGEITELELNRLNYVVSITLLVTYVTLFICVGEFI
jgi:hypothetical protein